MATPHLECNIDDVSDIVLMPGDPLRAKYIADNFLSDTKLINTVRNMFGYTGYYKKRRITVIGSGMGIPSMGIYSYELFKFYNVDKIIRVGTCGEYSSKIKLYDVILVDNSYSDSTYAYVHNEYKNNIIPSSNNLTSKIEETAKEKRINIIRSNVYTTDVFTPYSFKKVDFKQLEEKYNCSCTDMETFVLFYNAKILNKEAACVLTATDSLDENKSISSSKRETALNKMITLILESTLKL